MKGKGRPQRLAIAPFPVRSLPLRCGRPRPRSRRGSAAVRRRGNQTARLRRQGEGAGDVRRARAVFVLFRRQGTRARAMQSRRRRFRRPDGGAPFGHIKALALLFFLEGERPCLPLGGSTPAPGCAPAVSRNSGKCRKRLPHTTRERRPAGSLCVGKPFRLFAPYAVQRHALLVQLPLDAHAVFRGIGEWTVQTMSPVSQMRLCRRPFSASGAALGTGQAPYPPAGFNSG